LGEVINVKILTFNVKNKSSDLFLDSLNHNTTFQFCRTLFFNSLSIMQHLLNGCLKSSCFTFVLIFVMSLHLSVGLLNFVTETQQQQQANITHIITTLHEARERLAATSSGELVFFGGGYNSTT
jgi:hypothetical protein